jgi:hypothetical protein
VIVRVPILFSAPRLQGTGTGPPETEEQAMSDPYAFDDPEAEVEPLDADDDDLELEKDDADDDEQ